MRAAMVEAERRLEERAALLGVAWQAEVRAEQGRDG